MKPFFRDLAASSVHALANTFVVLIVILTIALLVVGKTGDAWFLASTISLNTFIAIFQEVHAKTALRKLELLKPKTATIQRNGHTRTVAMDQIMVGDHLVIESGEQIPADGQLIEASHLSINQALLTGESTEVERKPRDLVYAGSFVVTGKGVFRVTALGTYTRAGQMTSRLKWYQTKLTPLQKSLNHIIQFLTYAAIVFGLFIYFDGLRQELDIAGIFSAIASGAISIVPEGLLLASTLLFSYGAIKLVKEQVLIQRLAAVEGLSRLDILCLDKTGTLTSDQLTVEGVYPATNQIKRYLSAFISAKTANNSTFLALEDYLSPLPETTVHEMIPFSSSRKFSAILLQDGPERRALCLGGAELLLGEHTPARVSQEAGRGNRVLALVDYGPTLDVLAPSLKRDGKLLALIVLRQAIRPDAIDTLFYLQAQRIAIKVISGDNLETVQAIAKQVGILHTDKALTGDQLAGLSAKQWDKAVKETTIFARILPEQKERIIKTLQQHGFVGMVGDGVNDTLALKQADISLAMAEGSSAARQVADVVLLKNNFSALPVGMRLGSQIILGVEMVACLFFNKIIANSTILILSLLTSIPYPFTTRHLLLLNIFTVGIPTAIWSFAPAHASRRLSAQGLLSRSLNFTLPNGLITGLATIIAYSIGGNTAAFFVALVLGLVTFWLIPQYLHAIRNKNLLRWPLLYIIAALLIITFAGQLDIVQEVLELRYLTPLTWLFTLATTVLAGLAMRTLVHTGKQYVVKVKQNLHVPG